MNALIRAREIASSDPPIENSEVFSALLASLERGEPVSLARLYNLSYREFEVALGAMKDWRLHRFGFVRTVGPEN